MLKRNSFLEKRKKKKADLEKVFNMTKHKIEIDLKNQNRKSETDFINLEEIEPSKLQYTVSKDLQGLIAGFVKQINEYVVTNNEYV